MVLAGATLRLIDEWQLVPPLQAAVRGACDAEVCVFTDAAGTKADAIIDAGDRRRIAIKTKLGGSDHHDHGVDARALGDIAIKAKLGGSDHLYVVGLAEPDIKTGTTQPPVAFTDDHLSARPLSVESTE